MAILTNILHNWELLPEYDFGWTMKPLASAKTSFTIDKYGVYTLNIEHDIIKGVTPEMLLWWFKNIGGEMSCQGKVYPRYVVWHPKDHIHWSLAGKVTNKAIGVGSWFRIVEAFGRDMKCLVDSVELVEKLDETGIRLVKHIGSSGFFSLQHDFKQDGHNTIYKSQMMVGMQKKPFYKIFNTCIRPLIFTKAMGYAWLQHNIEEVGNFEFFLPELYDKEMSEKKRYTTSIHFMPSL